MIKNNKLSISFYLLSPTAKTQSAVYASLTKNSNRLRFATGEFFYTKYCNHREKKNGKDLFKRNTPFTLDYKTKLEKIESSLAHINSDMSRAGIDFNLTDIKQKFYEQSGLIEAPPEMSFNEAWLIFLKANAAQWQEATKQHFNAVYSHLQSFETDNGPITLSSINSDLWDKIRDQYFVEKKKFSNNSINKNLKKLKQFLLFAKKRGFISPLLDLTDFKFLEEIEPFKIALKFDEVEKLLAMDLKELNRLDKVRDLFALEILTGQRFSDIPSLLNKNNVSGNSIIIYQQKTGEKVSIPLHPKLKKHLSNIFDKYPEGLPIISNQKFNTYLKELCVKAGFDQKHSWVTMSGKTKTPQSDFRYNLVSSHSGRRTFCTLSLGAKINAETIMKVTGHRKYDQFREYVKVDDADTQNAYEGFLTKK